MLLKLFPSIVMIGSRTIASEKDCRPNTVMIMGRNNCLRNMDFIRVIPFDQLDYLNKLLLKVLIFTFFIWLDQLFHKKIGKGTKHETGFG